MINGYPTEEELRDRISRQLEWREQSSTVALIWHGYLASLLEWGLIDVQVFDRLSALLPRIGYQELHEMALDEPITLERAQELDALEHASEPGLAVPPALTSS